MKKNDIAILLIVAFIAGIFSFTISQYVFSTPKKKLSAEVVDPVTADFQKPDSNVFNENAINPTKLIQIGDGSNENPF